ncbi:magnesium and cobalt transport protein CorA [Novosphingobium sp. PS1R-30]|uniref:Magnesium and cobalt transport protein CorA n=1 Tax=Novosphingobium anseongense TaxID=3133436 RepID=A0ABU8RQX4_9SPHN|nr:MAG: magnesium and cobalt transport protein CorA [Novosphingobium sp.]
MPVVAARRYTSGLCSQTELAIDGSPREPLPDGCFDWVGVAEPTAEELELLRVQFGLHPLAVEDALNPNQLPKAEVYGKQLFIVARTAAIQEGEKIDYGQTAIFLGRDFIVSVRLGSTRAHVALRNKLETDSEHLAEGADYVAHAILDFIVDGYEPMMEKLDLAVQSMEERTIDIFPDPSTIRRIFRLRRQLRRFERIIGPMDTMCERLVRHDLSMVDTEARVWFRDVQDHVKRALARAASLKDTLASLVETASLLEQHRQGQMTRQLAAWAAILAVPTAIAGIYGMNFDVMPELRWRYGYFTVLGAIVLVCGGLWYRFRRIGWL